MSGLWQRILCATGRHKYRLIARVTPRADHIDCEGCHREWGMHHDVRSLLPWSDVAGLYAEAYGYRADEVFSLRAKASPPPSPDTEGGESDGRA